MFDSLNLQVPDMNKYQWWDADGNFMDQRLFLTGFDTGEASRSSCDLKPLIFGLLLIHMVLFTQIAMVFINYRENEDPSEIHRRSGEGLQSRAVLCR